MPAPRTTLALVGVTICILLGHISLAATDTDTTPGKTLLPPALRQPDRMVTVSGPDDCLVKYPISSDGRTAFVQDRYETININELIIDHWRYWGAVIAILGITIGLISIVKSIKNRRIIGEPYCRKCNYQLTGNVSGQCPECGKELNDRTIIVGRSIRRKVCFTSITSMIIPILYGLAFIPAIGNYLHWPEYKKFTLFSSSLYQWGENNNYTWLDKYETSIVSLRVLDLAENTYSDRLLSTPSGLYVCTKESPTSDIVAISNGFTTLLWDLKNKKIIKRLQLPLPDGWHETGISPGISSITWGSSHLLYTRIYRDEIVQWNLDTGRAEVITDSQSSTRYQSILQLIKNPKSPPLNYPDAKVDRQPGNYQDVFEVWYSDNEKLPRKVKLPFIEWCLSKNEQWLAAWDWAREMGYTINDTCATQEIMLINYQTGELVDRFIADVPPIEQSHFISVSNNGIISMVGFHEIEKKKKLMVNQFNRQQ